MADISFDEAVQHCINADPRYQPEAYEFVREALHAAIKKFCDGDQDKHVCGQQLLEGVRDHALKEYGPMALFVLRQWGLKEGLDVGHIVYNLIGVEYFGRIQGDSLEDFAEGYDFEEAFTTPFLPQKVSTSS
jgi:uncharacterized repeat protein (TIGR04138 family)